MLMKIEIRYCRPFATKGSIFSIFYRLESCRKFFVVYIVYGLFGRSHMLIVDMSFYESNYCNFKI